MNYVKRVLGALFILTLILDQFLPIKFSFISFSIPVLIVILFYFCILIEILYRNTLNYKFRFIVLLIGMWGIFSIIGGINAISVESYVRGVLTLIGNILIIFLPCLDKLNLKTRTFLFIIGGIIAALVSILVGFSIVDLDITKTNPTREIFSIKLPWKRTAGLFSTFGYYGMYMLYSFSFLFVYFLLERSSFKKIILFILLMLILFGLLMPLSRSILLGLITNLIFISLYYFFRFKKSFIFKFFCFFIVLFSGVHLYLHRDFLISLFNSLLLWNIHSVLIRIDQILYAYNLINKNFFYLLFGIGLEQFEFYFPEGRYSLHNFFFNILVSTGLISFLLFLFISMYSTIRYFTIIRRLNDSNLIFIKLAFVFAFLSNLVISLGVSTFAYLIVWYGLGILLCDNLT